MMKLTRAAVALLSLSLLAGPWALSARTAEPPCPNVVVHGDWSTIAAPAFTRGGGDLVAYAVHPRLPNLILVTNGQQVLISKDSGCKWDSFFTIDLLPSLVTPVSTANSRITSIDIPEHPSAGDAIYLVIEESVGPAIRPHVITGNGQDERFRSTIDGLPPLTGGVYGLHVAPSDPKVVYLHVRRNPATFEDDVYRSTNAGQTWQRRNNGSQASQDMGVDPLDPDEVWTWGASGLFHSIDGGRSRSWLNMVGTPTPLVDIFHERGKPARIMAYEAETQTFSVSDDGGTIWTRITGPPGFARSLAHGNDSEDVVMAQHDRVDRFKAPSYWIELEPGYEQPDLAEMSADRSPTPSIYGLTRRTIEKYTGLNNEIELPPFVPIAPTEILGSSALKPASTTLKLKAGHSQEVRYRFDLPANPKPLDVFFLVDTSDSMDSSIDGLREGMQHIADSLAASKIDVQFGVGEIKDYPIPGYGDPTQGDFPYRLNRAIGPTDDSLGDALEELEASGGGRADYEESQLTGLYQAATGEGEPGCLDSGEESQPCVPPGQGAGFRSEAIKVIVNITDYGFHDQAAHPSPPFTTVASELNNQGIFQIGLAVFGTQGIKAAIADLTDMAEGTGTTAPEPVDCDGNGTTDIKQGSALVCEISDLAGGGALNLAPAIIATVRAIADDVSVEMVTSDKKKSVVDVAPAVYPSVDITERNSLGFDLTFTCPRRLAGTTHDLRLAANVSGVPAASATAQLICKRIPAAALVKRQKPPPEPLVPAPVIPPGLVVVPAIAPAGPPPVPETITSTQSAAQAQGAIAKQKQNQLQFAVAYAQLKKDEAYALSSYTDRSRPSPAPLYLSAAVMTLGAAFTTLARTRPRLNRAGRRRG